jgi:hypothetical protein
MLLMNNHPVTACNPRNAMASLSKLLRFRDDSGNELALEKPHMKVTARLRDESQWILFYFI